MQTLAELNEHFAFDGLLSFEEVGDLTIARVTSPACTATLFLQGAHLVHWQPEGTEPVLFLSERSAFETGKAIRGGVPLVFPWFANRTGERTDGPSHGFARTTLWNLAFAAQSGDDIYLTLTLEPDDTSRGLGYDHFSVALELVLGSALTMRLVVLNSGKEELVYEDAMHTYLHVGSPEQVQISGLAGTEFLDKTDNFARKQQKEDVLTLHGETDRMYLNTVASVTVKDPVLDREIIVGKQGSETTVVWNPWTALSAKLPDMADDGWHNMLCIETANAGENKKTLQPGETHMMEARITVSQGRGSAV